MSLPPLRKLEIEPADVLTPPEIAATLDNLTRASVAVVGDFCLDVYWTIDPAGAEISLETGLPTRAVSQQRYSPGGAGNVVMNLAALGVPQIHPIGVVGDDPFGRELQRLFQHPHIDAGGLITQAAGWSTPTYIKPHENGTESNRIDFGNFNRLGDAALAEVIENLQRIVPTVSVVLINHQIAGSLHNSPAFRKSLAGMMDRYPQVGFVVDSRGFHEAYPRAAHKLNESEVMRAAGREPSRDSHTLEELVAEARMLNARWGSPLIVTRGENGCLVVDGENSRQIFGIQLMGQTDPVGAGDAFVSALVATLATGTNLVAAAFTANLAAAVTAQKLFQTGTASPSEILELGARADFVYRPELAASPRQAEMHAGTEIEVVSEPPTGLAIRHAIFDHDGTISTLREGWEKIMEPMMIKAVLGDRFKTADAALYGKVSARVRHLIDRTTGIQTLVQMRGLVELVEEFGCVPRGQILDARGYKEIYNVELKKLVDVRFAKLEKDELAVDDFTIKGAVPFLEALHAAGIRLYLASGTDDADVRQEAERLGYAGLFTGGIFGSVGDIAKDAKKMVIERILTEIGGVHGHLASFGDGPVEMRETVKRGSYAVGVASDEVRGFGQNPEKRARLIRAGACAIVPDFSQWRRLWNFLRLPGKV